MRKTKRALCVRINNFVRALTMNGWIAGDSFEGSFFARDWQCQHVSPIIAVHVLCTKTQGFSE